MAARSLRSSRLEREIKVLERSPISECQVTAFQNDVRKWTITFNGPNNSFYYNGKYCLDVTFPEDYPSSSPTLQFKTKLFHWHLCTKWGIYAGDLCDHAEWGRQYTISDIIQRIIEMMRSKEYDQSWWSLDSECEVEISLLWNLPKDYQNYVLDCWIRKDLQSLRSSFSNDLKSLIVVYTGEIEYPVAVYELWEQDPLLYEKIARVWNHEIGGVLPDAEILNYQGTYSRETNNGNCKCILL